ncbi:MAG: M20 family metallopeptidase [Peptococcaceae bacterium]
MMTNHTLQEPAEYIKRDQVVKVVQDLVKFSSVNPPGREKAVAEYLKGYLTVRNITTKTVAISQDRYNVVARLKGKGEAPPVVFTGHMDVVPVSKEERKRWLTEPFSGEIMDGCIYGRGAADMKGGLGAAMVAMVTLANSGITPPGDIILAATVDEEDLMRGAKALVNSDVISDARKIVVCEPTNLELVTCSRGRTWAEITVKGQTAHASQQGAGINAIERAVMLMDKIKNHQIPHEKHNLLGNSFWQITLIGGGIEPAIIPDSCTITVDARLVPGQLPDDIWGEMKKLIRELEKETPGFSADIEIIEGREPWETSEDDLLIHALARACECVGVPVRKGGFLATSDGTILRRLGMEAVIIGPGDLSAVHMENERVSIKQLIQSAQIYFLTMLNGKY